MEVFSTVVVEISATVCAFLPVDDNSGLKRRNKIHSGDSNTHGCSLECFDHESAELPNNYRTKFLEEKMKELNVSVFVISERVNDTASSLKLCGGWSEICAVRTWLLQFIKTPNIMRNIRSTEQLESGTRREVAVTEHCTELSDMPRRSFRNRHTAKQDCDADAVLLSSITKSSKQRKTKPSKENNVPMKKSKVLLINTAQSKSGSYNAGEEMLESYSTRNCDITKVGANVSGSLAPIMELTDEQVVTANSVVETDGALNIQTGVMSAACKELIQELKGPIGTEQPEQKLTLGVLKCDSCDYVTRKQRSLLMHTARMHGDRSYICPMCSHTFAIAKDLNQHLKSHTEQYCCEHCGRTLKSKYALALHVARIHKGLAPRPVKRYLCTLCGKMCRSRTDYNVHRNKEHTGMRPFHCDLCNASFFARSNLRAHRQIHADARNYECKLCGKAFKQRQGLRMHQAIHYVERPYKCEYCSKAFTQNSALVRHTRTHTSARPYACRLCPSTFNDYSVLRRHMIGVHKLQDATELRHSVQAACAEARLAQYPTAVSFDRSQPASSLTTDGNVNTSAASSVDDAALSTAAASACTDTAAGIPVKPDLHVCTSAGHMLAVLSKGHTDTRVSATDSLPHYFIIDAWRSADCHQQNL